MPEKHFRLLFRDAFLSTVFVFVCIAIFSLNPINLHVFDMIGDSLSDIEVTDIIFTDKNAKKTDIEAKISNDIVLINAADRGRGEIAALINKINEENPAVVGVDFIFEGPKSTLDDSLLKAAFNNTKNLVLAAKFKNVDESQHTNYISTSPILGHHKEGYANLMVTSMDKTVRYFRTKDEINNEEFIPFSVQVVKSFDSSIAIAFTNRKSKFELINYEGNLNAIHHYNGNDIENGNFPKGFLKNKIILIGFFGSDCNPNPILDDYFYTPLNEKLSGRKLPDSYGIVIQANIINMILSQKFIHKTSAFTDWTFGFMVCFLLNFIFIKHYVHRHLWYHFYAKLIQFGITFLLIFIFIYLFKTFHIKLSASPFILPVLLTVDLLYFYDTLVKWLNKKYKTKTYFLTGPMHH